MFVNYDFNIAVTKVISTVRLLHSPVGATTARNNRETWAVALKAGGKTFYTVNGKTVPSDKAHIVIMPKGSSYSWTCTEPGECIIIEFDADLTYPELFSFEVSDHSVFVKNFSRIERLMHEKGASYQTECIGLLYEILLCLLKSAKKAYTPKEKQHILLPAMEYISEKYYDSTITNEFLASLCGISTVYFRKTFEKVYGTSPIRYLNRFRIEKAKSMLRSDYNSITQIAESVGYSSIYHFSKMFKQYTGTSPIAYKNLHI